MRKRSAMLRNFILYILLLLLVITGSSDCRASLAQASLDGWQQTHQETSAPSRSAFSKPVLSQPALFTEQASVFRSTESAVGIVRSSRTVSHGKYELLFLFCVLTLLSVYCAFRERLFVLHDSRHVQKALFIISFIQDMDGKKRLS